jgi:uncharacterized membrane protein YebE (DUF533 family)
MRLCVQSHSKTNFGVQEMLKGNTLSFTKTEAESYLRALISVARSNGFVHDKEKEFIDIQAQLVSIESGRHWENEENDLSFLRNVNMSRMNRMAIIRDCIALGYIDGNFDNKQRANIAKVAGYLKLADSDIEDIETWLKELWAVLEKGRKLFEGNG